MTAPTCATCEHRRGHSDMQCGRGLTRDAGPVYGIVSVERTCEFERSRIWRWLDASTCGPEGRFWEPRLGRQWPEALPSAGKDESA